MPSIKIEGLNAEEAERYFKTLGIRFKTETEAFMHVQKDPLAKKIKERIPISRYHKSGRHAQVSHSIEGDNIYMGFYVKTRRARTIGNWREYGYLVFPEEGRGYTQKNTGAQRFFGRSEDTGVPEMFNKLVRILDNIVEST